MTESLFLHAVEQTLARIESALEQSGVDADCALSGLVLTIEMAGGNRIVVNAQAPFRQLWLASRIGAMHFERQGDAWHDVRTGGEFFEALSRAVSDLAGAEVVLTGA